MIEYLTKETFLEKIADYENSNTWEYKGELPGIIDFYADWCAPCKMMEPIIEEFSKEYEGKINFYKINTDTDAELAVAFMISSIPSFLFVAKNETPKMTVGALSKMEFKEFIENEFLKDIKENNG